MSEPGQVVVRQPAEGRTIGIVGDIYRFLAIGEETGGRYVLFEAGDWIPASTLAPRDFRGFPSATGHGTSRPQNSPDYFTLGLDGVDNCIYKYMKGRKP